MHELNTPREVEPIPKLGPKPKKKSSGRADPDRAMAAWCELRDEFPDSCLGPASHRHHKCRGPRRRNDGPTMDLCAHCHLVEVHGYPARAYAAGWLLKDRA